MGSGSRNFRAKPDPKVQHRNWNDLSSMASTGAFACRGPNRSLWRQGRHRCGSPGAYRSPSGPSVCNPRPRAAPPITICVSGKSALATSAARHSPVAFRVEAAVRGRWRSWRDARVVWRGVLQRRQTTGSPRAGAGRVRTMRCRGAHSLRIAMLP